MNGENPLVKKVKCKHCHGSGRVKNNQMCRRCRGVGYWGKSLDDKVLTICQDCHGTGYSNKGVSRSYSYAIPDSAIQTICRSCDGYGYKDWIHKVLAP